MEKTAIDVSTREIEGFCQKHNIRRLSFFGSVTREDFGPLSDVDVLVEFQPGFIPGFDFFLMEAELSHLLGRKVDFQTLSFLSPEIRRQIMEEAVIVYEQA